MTHLPGIANPIRKPYPSDLSDSEWEILKQVLPQAKGFGHPVEVDFREILNGIFYVQRTGCQWEMMPHELPPYSTVYRYFQKWQRKGIWQQMHDESRENLPTQLGREEQSSVAIADSQSVKTTEKRGWSTGLTVARRLKPVSAISLWIRKGC
jgi:putative transposase